MNMIVGHISHHIAIPYVNEIPAEAVHRESSPVVVCMQHSCDRVFV